MRQILMDYARGSQRQRRGGGLPNENVDLVDRALPNPDGELDVDTLLDLDAALTAMAANDSRMASIMELHIFAGLTYDKIAEILDIGRATVFRDAKLARAWLSLRLDPDLSHRRQS